MAWRAARSLLKLRDQVNERFPGRNKSADGLVGDSQHRSRKSDHNPDRHGVVRALDLTHDLRVGFDTWALGEVLRRGRDNRISYVISNKRIFSATTRPWVWRPYTGGNPHSHHIHISSRPPHDDEARDWALAWNATPGGSTEEQPLVRPVLRLGSPRSEDVRSLQLALEITVDGIFGPQTDAAVRAFQLEAQIAVDGIVGPVTWEKLGVTAEPD